MKVFLKQLFCNHVNKLETREYLYSGGIRILGEFRPYREYYAYTYKCLKCQKVRIEEREVDVI
jgi:hypothetical protein